MLSMPKPKREFYIPTGATRVAPKCGGVEFWIYTDGQGRPCARCFVGRAQKPTWNHWFRSTADREKRIAAQIKSVQVREADKAARRKAAAKPHGWEPGMILAGSWGYEQTNVDFFEIVRVVGKTMVEIVEIGAQECNRHQPGFAAMSSHVVPNPDARGTTTTKVRVSHGSCRSPKYGYLHPWDGKPKYCSWYA